MTRTTSLTPLIADHLADMNEKQLRNLAERAGVPQFALLRIRAGHEPVGWIRRKLADTLRLQDEHDAA